MKSSKRESAKKPSGFKREKEELDCPHNLDNFHEKPSSIVQTKHRNPKQLVNSFLPALATEAGNPANLDPDNGPAETGPPSPVSERRRHILSRYIRKDDSRSHAQKEHDASQTRRRLASSPHTTQAVQAHWFYIRHARLDFYAEEERLLRTQLGGVRHGGPRERG